MEELFLKRNWDYPEIEEWPVEFEIIKPCAPVCPPNCPPLCYPACRPRKPPACNPAFTNY